LGGIPIEGAILVHKIDTNHASFDVCM